MGRVYWKENDLDRIVQYCQRDVITVVNLILKLKGMVLISNNQITYSE